MSEPPPMPDPKRNWEAIRREFMAEPIKDERDRIIRGLMTQWEFAERTGNDGLATLFQGAVRLILEAETNEIRATERPARD